MECIIELTGPNAPAEVHYLEEYLEAQGLPMVIIGPPILASETPTLGIDDFLPVINLLVESRTAHMAIKGLFDLIKSYFELRQVECRKVKFSFVDKDGRKYELECQALEEVEQAKFNEIIEKIIMK